MEDKKCLNCNTTLPENATYCHKCGQATHQYCPYCKEELQPSAHFCNKCGKAVLKPPYNEQNNSSANGLAPGLSHLKFRETPQAIEFDCTSRYDAEKEVSPNIIVIYLYKMFQIVASENTIRKALWRVQGKNGYFTHKEGHRITPTGAKYIEDKLKIS